MKKSTLIIATILFSISMTAKENKNKRSTASAAIGGKIECTSDQYVFFASFMSSVPDGFQLGTTDLKFENKTILKDFKSNGYVGSSVVDKKGNIKVYGSPFGPTKFVGFNDGGSLYRIDLSSYDVDAPDVTAVLQIEAWADTESKKIKMKCAVGEPS